MSCFSFYFFFSSAKLESKRVEKDLPSGQGWYQWEGMMWPGKGVGGLTWCKKCVHVYVSAKIIPVETSPVICGGGGG
jgi:hypothetical protein